MTVNCPDCRHPITIQTGGQYRCPNCQGRVAVPEPPPKPEPPPSVVFDRSVFPGKPGEFAAVQLLLCQSMRFMVWVILIVVVLTFAVKLDAAFHKEDSAIRQSAIASLGCLRCLAAYIVARAVDSMLRLLTPTGGEK